MKTLWVLPGVTFFFAVCLGVAQQQPPDNPASKDDIVRLFAVMQVRQQMQLVIESVSKQQTSLVHETVLKKYPRLTKQQLARLDNIMQESMKDFPVDGMLDDMIPVYQNHLSKADVDAMSSFYSSPTGQKLLKEMPAMTSESMQAAYGRLQKQTEEMMNRIDRIMKEEQQRRASPQPKSTPQSLQD